MFQKWFQLKCTKIGLQITTWQGHGSQGKIGSALLIFLGINIFNPIIGSLTGLLSQEDAGNFLLSSAYAAKKSALPQLPVLLKEVEAKYAQAATLTAQFTQNTQDGLLGKEKQTSGTIYIKRPSQVRWETKQPEENLLVSDGKQYWFYTPPFDEGESGQVIEKKISDVHSQLAEALLSGSFSMNRDMKIEKKTKSTFLLIPKKGSAGTVKQALVEIDPQEKLIQKITLTHETGNKAVIQLSQIQLGKPLDQALFRFKAPPNTEIIQEFEQK